MIRDMAKDKTIVLSTHILEEVEQVCTRAVIIARGRIVADDTPEGLRKRSDLHGAMRLTVRGTQKDDLLQWLRNLPQIGRSEVLSESGSEVSVRLYPRNGEALAEGGADEVLRGLVERGESVQAFFMEKGRLDEVFRTVTRPDAQAGPKEADV